MKHVIYIASLLVLVAACSHLTDVVTIDGKDYIVTTTEVCGYEWSKTRKPIVTAQQRALEDARAAKNKARAMYRWIAAACAVGAILCFVVASLSSWREAAGAGVILGIASVVCIWVSVAALNPWVICGGIVAILVAVVVHFKLIDFDLVTKIKDRRAKMKG